MLLPEPEQSVEHHHEKDHEGILEIAYRAGEEARPDQHEDQPALELVGKAEPRRSRRDFPQAVFAKTVQPGADLPTVQADCGIDLLPANGLVHG